MTMRNAFENLATESKQDDLNALVEALNTASASILTAVQAINGKVTACNTGAVTVSNFPSTQAVSIDAASLSALENVSINNFPATQPVSGTVAVSNMVSQGLTDLQLRATDVKVTLDGETVSISNQLSQPVTDAQLRAEDVKVTLDGEQVAISNFPATQLVSGSVSVSNMVSQGLTDSQLRASDVKVSLDGEQVVISNQISQPLTDAQLRESDVKVTLDGESVSISNQLSQPITDSQLRASDVKVSLDGEQVAISNFPGTQAVSGPITNAELRASAVPVSLDSSGISSTDLQLEILNMLRLIKTTLNRLPFYDPTLNRGRMTAILESGTVTTCGTVTNMTNVGSYTWNAMVQMQNRSSWANNCGSKIS